MKPVQALIFLGLGLLTGCDLLDNLNLLAPENVPGVRCPDEQVCLDDPARESEARALYQEAFAFVGALPGGLQSRPKVVFCSTESCYRGFGLEHSAGTTIATLGIVIAPRGWTDYYLRHEMIHYQQSEQLGQVRHMLMPAWFREGMAYDLSLDPRPVLTEPFESYRRQFRSWYAGISSKQLWDAASRL